MSITRTVREIGGVRYAIQTVPSLQGRKLHFRLLKICGPALTRALRAGVFNMRALFGGNATANVAAAGLVSDAFDELFERFSEDDLELFVQTFAEHTFVLGADGAELQLKKTIDSLAFAGRPGLLVSWLRACWEHSLTSFLADLGVTIPPILGTPAAASPSPTT